ncbi:hypothetical protein SODALDRAFT_330264 [Sodiomyces alkalinus F11]|uniref:RING-type domain-containing protein n=1 Tax=Sodiomyces alkalinus (strain CBS 110278 / VKM F-3762 / F11) TaxID=1314773 RepID=A0A3N2Q1A1_SODAK|nr:hypothetical protein SODALDRAFT_330264 [Sodiomyces alkalinus F11]ROT40539.1 hypothetical protein SODALDRAFT_330264 [Sodiomyces alkalinus F11]
MLPSVESLRLYLKSTTERERQQKYHNNEGQEGDEKEKTSRLKGWLSLIRHWLKPKDSEMAKSSFVPCPKVTFLIDKPDKIHCQICKCTRLLFQSEEAAQEADGSWGDSVPAMMPCGHVAGAACLDAWFADHDTCPFCRRRLVYRKCGHKVTTRHVTHEGLFLIPMTIPEGGAIPDLCIKCQQKGLIQTVNVRYQACCRRFVNARKRFQDSPGEVELRALVDRKSELERLVFEEYHVQVINAWLRHW